MYLLAFVACTTFYFFLKVLWKRRRIYYYAAKVEGPLAFPLIGSAYIFALGTQNIMETSLNLIDKYKPLFKFWLGPQLCFIVTQPRNIEIVLNKALEKKETSYSFLIPVFGDGLITLPVDQWKKHRRVINLTFNQKILNSFVDTFVKCSNNLVERLKETLGLGCIDFFPILSQCALDMVCDTTMGTEVNALKERSQYIVWTSRASELGFKRIFNIFLHPNFIWKCTSLYKEMRSTSQKMNDYVKKIIEDRRNMKVSAPKKKIFLDYLLELTASDGNWSDEELIDETRTIIIAGSDATALTVGHVLMMLGMHQEIQDKTYVEISSVFGGSTRNATFEDLQNLEYLDRVIKETLRLFPIGSILGRQLTKDLVLGNHLLPQGSSICIPVIYIHRDPEIWDDPLRFDPDRFVPEEASRRHLYSYIPFSGGPRNCIGYRYAMLALKTILSTVLRYYKVAETGYDSIDGIELKFDVATKCVNGQKIRLEVR